MQLKPKHNPKTLFPQTKTLVDVRRQTKSCAQRQAVSSPVGLGGGGGVPLRVGFSSWVLFSFVSGLYGAGSAAGWGEADESFQAEEEGKGEGNLSKSGGKGIYQHEAELLVFDFLYIWGRGFSDFES